MGLLPDCFTAHCPGSAYTHKPVLLCMIEKKSDVDEKHPDENREREVRADLVPDAPEYNLDLDGQHEEDKQENESIVIIPEFLVVLFVWIDAGKNCQQGDKAGHDEADEKESPELRHGAVSLTGSVPVRYDAIGSCRVDSYGNGEGNTQSGNDCQPDKIHTTLLGSDPVIR